MISKKIKIFFVVLFPFLFSLNAYAGKMVDSSGNSVYAFIVDNPSMVDAYFNIFNAMASFFQSNDYLELLKVVFLLGGLTVFFTGVMKVYQGGDAKGSLGEFVKYMILGTALLTIIFSHKSQMIIKTNNLPSFCPSGPTSSTSIISSTPTTTGVVVGNIPEVLAWTFSLINEVGRETTRLATMGFTAVDANLTTYTNRSDYASYLQGVGSVLGKTLNDYNTKFNDSNNISLQQGLESIFRDCIAAPAANSGDEGMAVMTAFTNTGNLRQTLTDYMTTGNVNVYKNPTDIATINTLVTSYKSGGKAPKDFLTTVNGSTYACSQVHNVVETLFNTLMTKDDLVCSKNLKDYWNPETMAIFTGDKTINTVTQAKTIALQAALANEVMDSKNNIAPAELSFASGKSTAEFVTNSLGTGYYMAQMLPYLQMGMRAVMYAFFPFVFIVILLPGGMKVLVSYLQTLIWIELWSPTAAVLNMFLSIMATDKFADMYNTEGFNGAQGLATFSDSAMLASVAGYLYASVPALTWLILKGSGQMLGNITGAIGSRMAANLNSDSIIKDKKQLESLSKANEDRKSKGQQMISLAEMDSLNAKHEAWTEAGNFQAKNETMNKAYNAGYGKQMLDVTKSAAIGELFNGPNGEKFKNATGLNTQNEMKRNVVELEKTGQMDSHGNINEKEANRVNIGVGTDKAIQTNTTVGTHELNQGRDLNYENKKAEAQAIDKSSKDFALQKEQEIRTGMHDKDPNSTKDKLKEAEIAEMTKIATGLQNETKDQSYFMQKGVFNKDSDGNVVRNGETFNKEQIQEIMYKTGRFNAAMQDVQDQVNQGKITNHGKADLVKNELITLAKTVGANKESQEFFKRGLEQVVKNGGADSAKAQEALNEFNKGNFFQGLSKSAGVASLQGVMSDMYNKVQGDEKTGNLNDANVTSKDLANIEANKITSEIQSSAESYKELSRTDLGKAELSKAAEQITNLDKNGEALTHLNDTKQVTDKNGNISFEPTENAKKAQQLVANRALSNMKAETEGFKTTFDNSEVNRLNENGNKADIMGDKGAVTKEIDYYKNAVYTAMGAESKAGIDLFKEGVATGKSGAQIVNSILELPNLDQKVKDKLEKVKSDWSGNGGNSNGGNSNVRNSNGGNGKKPKNTRR